MDNRMSLLSSPFVPEGMVDLMKKLSKGVIKERPSNIYEYAANFFENMLIERDGSLDKGYGKFRSYTEYCKFMDKMDQRRSNQTAKKDDDIAAITDTVDAPQEEIVEPSNIEVQGVAIQGVERKSRDSVKNVSINPKYKSQSEKTAKPVVSNVKSVKTKPRKLSSKKPSENLIVIKEETSADVDDNSNGEAKQHKAALTIQNAFRMYVNKKRSQAEHSSENLGNVSKLTEDAAAVVIQKAFKSLIQKLKPEANQEKITDESNNNIVIPGAGQENAINVDKIINNSDEHSAQILVDDDQMDTTQDLEYKDEVLENTIESTTTNVESETNEPTNLEGDTALDAAGTLEAETEQMKIEVNNSVSDDFNNQAAIVFDKNIESRDNQEEATHQLNEAPTPASAVPLDSETEARNIEEAVDPQKPVLEDVQLKDQEIVGNDPVDIEIKPSENEVPVITSENFESAEALVKEEISDHLAETEVIANQTEMTPKSRENLSDDEDVGKISTASEQRDITTPLNLAVTNSKVDHSGTDTNAEAEIDQIEKQEIVSELEQTTLEPIESAPEEGRNDVSDNFKTKSLSNDIILTEEKVLESVKPEKDQLFVVEKDGIYVNLDLLQEKFGTTEIDEAAGSDSEKTFKLNILEREEILVNQENFQQITAEALTPHDDVVDKLSKIMADESEQGVDEEMEGRAANNNDIKDEEGNEEYELAETVVLMDIPYKPQVENEELLPIATSENAAFNPMKVNKLNEEIRKPEPSLIHEKSLETFSDSITMQDDTRNEEVVETKLDVVDSVSSEVIAEKLGVMEDKLNKIEDPLSLSNLEEVSIKKHDIGDEKAKLENVHDHLDTNESTTSDPTTVANVKTVIGDEEMKNENFESKENETELTASDSAKIEAALDGEQLGGASHSEKLVDVEPVIRDEETQNQNVETQLIEPESTTTDSENVETEVEDEATNEKTVETEEPVSASENILSVEPVEKKDFKDGNVEKQLNINEAPAYESENVEAEFKDEKPDDEYVTSQVDDVESTTTQRDEEAEDVKHSETGLAVQDSEKTVKVEADPVHTETTKNEKVENQMNDDEPEPGLADSKISSVKEVGVDGVDVKDEHNEDNNGATKVEIDNAVDSNEPTAKSKDQLDEQVMENNDELESRQNNVDEVVQETVQSTLQEIETTSSSSEKNYLVNTEDKNAERDTEPESSDQTFTNAENEELVKAATVIQKIFRGYVVRNSAIFDGNSKSDKLQLSAALIIQKYVRGYLVRRNMQKADRSTIVQGISNEMEGDGNDRSSISEAVPQLPAYSNRFLIPKDSFLERESFADDEDYARTCKELAATSIQKTYRGYRVRRSLKASSETSDTDAGIDDVHQGVESSAGNDQIQTAVIEAERLITDVLNVAADVLPAETYDLDSFEEEVTDDKSVGLHQESHTISNEPTVYHDSVLGQHVHDNIHVEGQMQQKYNQMKFQGTPINPIEEMSDSSENLETPRDKRVSAIKSKTLESDSLDSKDYDGSKSFSYEQLSSDLSDTEENKKESLKESEVDETSRDERDDLSEVENFDLSSCGEDSLEAMYYSLRKNEIMVDRMHKQVAGQRESKNSDSTENLKVEFPERVTENLDVAMQQVFKSMESSSDYEGGKKDEDDNSSTLDLALDDSSSINDEKEIETSRQIKPTEDGNLESNEDSEFTADAEEVGPRREVDTSGMEQSDQSYSSKNVDKYVETSNMEPSEQSDSSLNIEGDVQTRNMEQIEESVSSEIAARDAETSNTEQSEQSDRSVNIEREDEETISVDQSHQSQSDSSVNSSTRFIMKSQSVSEDMMNPIMFAMKRKQALLDQLHVRHYPLEENLSEDHDAFPEHLLTDIDIGNIQRKIFASSISETDSDYIEPTAGRRLVRDDFNISTALDHLSTDSDSTIISAATKIQAGARGFLTRRRLRRSSAGGTSISFEKRYSFGNAAIDKSLEDLIKMQEQINLDGAALKIQQQYRRYQARKNNLKKVSPIREQTTLELSGGSSIEGTDDTIGIREITLAQKKVDDNEENVEERMDSHPISLNIDTVESVAPVKRTPVNQRRLTLQRGDAVQRNSRPDSQELTGKDGDIISPDNRSTEKFKDSETGEYTGTTSKPEKKVTAYINIQSLINRGIGPRQRSMPVQIDSELMRILPKHLRKRVKSADMAKKRSG